jgi:quinoprotein dehydrogenase-associated probable ABC transporter substrate-binding protein
MFLATKLGTAWICGALALQCLAAPPLRICSDPSNLPYSNQQEQGFENQLARLIAKDLKRQVIYFWFPQREKFFKQTLNSGACDVVMGVPVGFDEADVTAPYYRSAYVFVSRRDRNLRISSLDDPRLHDLRIGVHVLGEEDDSLPPVNALTSRGIVKNLVGYSIFGNLNETDPPADLLEAVQKRDVDIAIAWGPLAGYFAKQSQVPLDITPINPDRKNPELPLVFSIGIGVRHGDTTLKQQLDTELIRRHQEIEHILNSFGIPQPSPAAEQASGDLTNASH